MRSFFYLVLVVLANVNPIDASVPRADKAFVGFTTTSSSADSAKTTLPPQTSPASTGTASIPGVDTTTTGASTVPTETGSLTSRTIITPMATHRPVASGEYRLRTQKIGAGVDKSPLNNLFLGAWSHRDLVPMFGYFLSMITMVIETAEFES